MWLSDVSSFYCIHLGSALLAASRNPARNYLLIGCGSSSAVIADCTHTWLSLCEHVADRIRCIRTSTLVYVHLLLVPAEITQVRSTH